MRCPIIIAVEQGVTGRQALPDVDSIAPSTAGDGAFILRKGEHSALAYRLGSVTVGGTTYRVFAVLYRRGDQRKVYRFLRSQNVMGPYTRHNAPTALRSWLRELTAERDESGDIVALGPARVPIAWAGEDTDQLDRLDYVEGADPTGDDDAIVIAG